MAKRKAWDDLSPGYRRRLERQGVTRDTHGQADLGLARGHSPYTLPRGRYPAPWEATQAALTGSSTLEDEALLRRWWAHHAPSHLRTKAPDGSFYLSWDSGAALSQILSPPSTWAAVRVLYAPGSAQSFVEVEFDDGSVTTVAIPKGTEQEIVEWAWSVDGADGEPLDIDVGTT